MKRNFYFVNSITRRIKSGIKTNKFDLRINAFARISIKLEFDFLVKRNSANIFFINKSRKINSVRIN